MFTFLISITGFGQTSPGVKSGDSSFLLKNIADHTNETAFLQIARSKADDPQLKNIADQIFTDHSEILNDLKRIAKKMSISMPDNDNAPEAKDGVRGTKMQDFENTTGREFEKAWVAQAINMHEAKLTELENSAGQLSDAELKAVVNKALSKIRVHRDMLRRIKYKYEK